MFYFLFLQWKSQSETVYFDPPSLRGFAQNRSADSFVDNLQAPRPFFAGSSSASGFHVEGSSVHMSLPIFGEVDALQGKTYELSLQWPGTSARMSHVAGLLPPDRCLDAEGSKEFLDLEAANLSHYQNSILHIRQGLGVLKVAQDVRCRPYEVEAQAFLDDMNKADLESAKTAASAAAAAAASGTSADGVAPIENVSKLYYLSFYV